MPPVGDYLHDAVHALWSPATWRSTAHLVAGAALGALSVLVISALLVLSVVLVPTVLGAPAAVAVLLATNRLLTSVQRSRFDALLAVHIPRGRPWRSEPTLWRRARRELTDVGTWRQLAYHMVAGVLGVVVALVVVLAWVAGLLLTPAVVLGPLAGGVGLLESLAASATGLVLLGLAPWLARWGAVADVAIAQSLLGSPATEALTEQVEALSRSRHGAVDAADAERRRIERDLHDGAQQRLTSLALNLGIAVETMTDLPEPARAVIAEAHDEAKQALAELRNLIRGLHPAVIDDRGLDAALSGVAARSPVPVRLRAVVGQRPSPEIEMAAYFVVSEALTNAIRHAEASVVDIDVVRRRNRLWITVTDDGRGGARAGKGTGLTGLAARVRSVDGTLRIDSPSGGPTRVAAELPCEL